MSLNKRSIRWVLLGSLIVLTGVPAALAATYTAPAGTIHAGTNYLSLPAIPSGTNVDAAVVFAGIPINGKLFYWCRQTQLWEVYPTQWMIYPWHMGFRLDADQDYSLSFQGAQSTVERSTCLNPLIAGMANISQPYNFEALWSDFTFSSDKLPGQRFTTAQAVANGWIEPYLIQDDPASAHIPLADGRFKPWHSYWVTSKVAPTENKLTIYWPTTPAPEPGALVLLAAGCLALIRRPTRGRP